MSASPQQQLSKGENNEGSKISLRLADAAGSIQRPERRVDKARTGADNGEAGPSTIPGPRRKLFGQWTSCGQGRSSRPAATHLAEKADQARPRRDPPFCTAQAQAQVGVPSLPSFSSSAQV